MIPDEMLREAAKRTYEKYILDLLRNYDPEYQHKFSLNFEKKIKKLIRRAMHPILYQSMRRIAVIFLALLLAGTIWITIDAHARAAFFGWFSEITDGYFVYHHEGTTSDNSDSANYRPSWIPNGYMEESVKVFTDKTTVRYRNNKGELLRFSYVETQENVNWAFDISKGHMQSCHVGECTATLFISAEDDVANGLIWVNEDDVAFCVTGFISEGVLIRIAESVNITKNN